MAASPSVTVGANGLVVGGRERRLLSGEVHFWRLDPAEWEAVLDAVQSLGFTAVSTYVSWARHEVGPGQYRWEGAFDLDRFLSLVHERGLMAVVRVGPNTAAEQEDAGWPRRVLDDPDCQARRPGGIPYLLPTATHHAYMPSYASKATLRAIGEWYDEVVPGVAKWQWPDGPVIAAQVDNELGYHFQAHAYALDYHPDCIEQYREFTGDPSAEPPRDEADGDEARRVQWVEFKEHHLRRTLSTLADMVRSRGLDRVPLLHNDYPRTTTPLDLGALEASGAVDVAGADIYVTKEGGRFVTDLARHLAGSSKLPYMAELGTGWLTFPWLLPMRTTEVDEQHAALRAFLGGVRAANVYMLVERDRWYGSPISAHGQVRAKGEFYRRLHSLLDDLEWETLRRDVQVLLVENRDSARRSAAGAILGDVVPPFAQMLPLDPRLFDGPPDPAAAWLDAAARALVAAGVDFDRASSSSMPVDAGERYSHLVGFGLEALGCIGPSDPASVVELVPRPVFRRDCPDVDLVRLVGPGREVLALASASGEPQAVTISFDGAVALHGVWEAESLKGEGSVVAQVPPWGVQIWEVHR